MFLLFVLPLWVNYDFYEYHVWQCEQAHAEGKAFNLYTGKTVDPPFNAGNPWIVYPFEKPRSDVPHGCVGEPQSILVFGFYGLWVTDTNITRFNVGDLRDTMVSGD